MAGPLDRNALHQRLDSNTRPQLGASKTETEIDALLSEHDRRISSQRQPSASSPDRSPLDQLRDEFRDRLIPLVERLAAKYGPKGVIVTMNAEDFLNGGRSIIIDVAFGGYRTVQEGTVMTDSIAFSEINHMPNLGETVSAGKTLRKRHLTEEGMADFILKTVAALIRAANRSGPAR